MTKIQKTIFIGDTHYNSDRTHLMSVLETFMNHEAQTIFLCGDIFDFLSEDIEYFKLQNQEPIRLINKLSKTKNIIYLEGNHDFNLRDIFPKCEVISRENQPYIFNLKNKTTAISHGDIGTPALYNIYTYIIRSRAMGKLLNILDIGGIISKIVQRNLQAKLICKQMKNFDNFAIKRLLFYEKHKVDIVIEAHYHQGKRYRNYINLPGFACDKTYLTQDDLL